MDVRAQLIGYPRIGPNREMKWALERAWSGRMAREAFASRAEELRTAHLAEQQAAMGSAVDDFFLYDEVLETALMLGVAPAWAGELQADAFGTLTALARGIPEHEAWEMTKWFDTNYHYVVPEIERPIEALTPLPWRTPHGDGSTWAILGPYSLVKLSKLAPGLDPTFLARAAGRALWTWARQQIARDPGFRLQVDEPSLGLVLDERDRAIRDAAYADAGDLGGSAAPLVTVQFGAASADTLEKLGSTGFAVQVPLASAAALHGSAAWDAQPEHVLAVMDGRSVWPDDFDQAKRLLAEVPDDGKPVRIIPSTSLQFLPYTVEGEDLPAGFEFAREKARALAGWARALNDGSSVTTQHPPQAEWPEVGEITARATRSERRERQRDLDLPLYPTTSTGSLPQTGDVRQLRVRRNKGEIGRDEYQREMERLITDAIAWQEAKGIDVLVHGEFERTDMVEYFAEQLDGYYTTRNGWVLSYGSRSIRPPILAAPPVAHGPMTVQEWKVAQGATGKPVKGMLTGPVTIVNWSFRPPGVPDDRLFWAVAQPVAEEVRHLVDAGCRIVQVDEPAVRERWPFATEDAEERRRIYGRGVRTGLNYVFNQPAEVQMHTHMCYGDFGDIVPLWSDAGVDVASIEFSRSKDDSYIRQFYELFGDGHLQIGPGVFDVHSPHTPGSDVMAERLRYFRGFMADEDLWVNPDCGLKTRGWEEIDRQLGDMVVAARALRPVPAAS
jgi:5-methyltetrahydropteroyltriglutamate--homocysteine methyltransferase